MQASNQLPGVVGATSPYHTQAITPDGRYSLITVQFAEVADQLTEAERAAYEELGTGAPAGWTVAAGGEPLLTEPEIGSTEAIGVAVALVVLVITFGSLVAAGMTMANALIGVGIGYSLFISSRYRHNLELGLEPEEAAGRAVGTAGSAVLPPVPRSSSPWPA